MKNQRLYVNEKNQSNSINCHYSDPKKFFSKNRPSQIALVKADLILMNKCEHFEFIVDHTFRSEIIPKDEKHLGDTKDALEKKAAE